MNKFNKKENIQVTLNNDRLTVKILSVISFVLLIVIVLILFNNIIVRSNKDTFKSIVNLSSLTDPLRQFYKADDLVINVQPLRDQLNVIGKNQNVSIYFEALGTGT